jgi:hypothetical protein
MKTTYFTIAIVIGIMTAGCGGTKEKTAEELLKTPKMEDEIYFTILSDNAHLSKFMEKMMEEENCRKMMLTNKPMIKMMCMSENVDTLMNTDKEVRESITNKMIKSMTMDSTVCDHTCTRIMAEGKLKNYFNKYENRMNEKTNSKSKK